MRVVVPSILDASLLTAYTFGICEGISPGHKRKANRVFFSTLRGACLNFYCEQVSAASLVEFRVKILFTREIIAL